MAEHDHNHDALPDDAPPPPVARGASVRLRQTAPGSPGAGPRVDPANQSLADALRFTYGLLKFVMVVLVALFFISGVKTIQEGERGIRVFLGRPTSFNLTPGIHPNLPFPMGEMIRIGEGSVETRLGLAFMPYGSNIGNNEIVAMSATLPQFSSEGRLNPARSFSNITSDLNLAHTQWTVTHRRTDHRLYAENMIPEQEERIVRLAVQRGVVQTIASVTIDDLLKQTGDSSSAARVREIAQRQLDDIGSGITIDRVTLSRKIPPISLADRFNNVQAASQRAAKEREDALLHRDQQLNEVAGAAAPVLIDAINEYERLIELGLTDEATALLTRIDAVLEGRPAEILGAVHAAGLVSGSVSELIEFVRGQVSTRVTQAIADRDLFRAKLAQYESNPRLMISRDWSAAMTVFLNRPFVQVMSLPRGRSTAELLINQDPSIVRELDRARKQAEVDRANEERMNRFQRDLFRTRRGIQEREE